MNCPTCDYALWNLRERRCPECGREFRPSEFSFVPNAVRFLCPHCGQDYYGTDENGHLVPSAFTCVRCAAPISMDEMVLLPTEGVSERQTRPDPMPWLDKSHGGFFKRWWSTLIRSLGTPGRLINATPIESSVGAAAGFAALNAAVPATVAFAMSAAIMFIFMMAMARGGGPAGGAFASLPLIAGGLIFALAILIWLGLWTVLTHGLLRLLNAGHAGIRRTFQSLAYSSGPNVITALPCITHMVAPLAWIWWMVGATIMVKQAHRIPAWKASIATLVPPLLGLAGGIGLLVMGIYTAQSVAVRAAAAASAAGGTISSMYVGSVATALRDHADETGEYPPHAAQLVVDGRVMAHQFTLTPGSPMSGKTNIGGTRLDQLFMMSGRQQRQAIDAAVAAMGPGIVAHRIGDFVFTYHGLGPDADGDLWILIATPDPADAAAAGAPQPAEPEPDDPDLSNPAAPPPPNVFFVVTAGGETRTITANAFMQELNTQNAHREANGLPPLPHPGVVQNHWRP